MEQLAAEKDEKDGNVRRRDPGDTGSLGYRPGAVAFKLDTAFHREGGQALKIEIFGNFQILKAKYLFGEAALPVYIPCILDPDFSCIEDFFFVISDLRRNFPAGPGKK